MFSSSVRVRDWGSVGRRGRREGCGAAVREWSGPKGRGREKGVRTLVLPVLYKHILVYRHVLLRSL